MANIFSRAAAKAVSIVNANKKGAVKIAAIAGATIVNPALGAATAAALNAPRSSVSTAADNNAVILSTAPAIDTIQNTAPVAREAAQAARDSSASVVLGMPRQTAIYVGIGLAVVICIVVGVAMRRRRRS